MAKTCKVPGCTRPVHVNKQGRVYAKCHEHMKEYWRGNYRANNNPTPVDGRHDSQPRDELVTMISAKKVAETPAGCIQIVYPCARHQRMIYLNATVDHDIPMPATKEEMRELIKQHADDGILLAVEVTYGP